MADINLPFGASATRRAPTTGELSSGFPCGEADQELFNWLAWYQTAQIGGAISKSGFTPADDNADQLATTIRSQKLNYVVASGTANALTVALNPAPTTWADVLNVPIDVRVTSTNTAAAPVFNITGVTGSKTIVRQDGGSVQPRDLAAGAIVRVRYDGSNVRLDYTSRAEFRRRLFADTTFYIRSDGSDSNQGLSNSSGGAFQTIAGAFTRVSQEYDTAGFTVTFELGMAGTYVGAAFPSLGGTWELVGSSWANAGSYVIESPPGLPYTIFSELSDLRIRRCMLRTVYAGTPTIETGVQAANGGNILLDDVVVSQANNRAGYRDIYVNTRGNVRSINRVQFGGAGSRFVPVECVNQGIFIASDNPAVPTQFFSSGTMSMTGFWCRCTIGGLANWTSCNLSGAAATGARYYADTGGGIDTGGGGADYFPGNAGGTAVAASMGWYR